MIWSRVWMVRGSALFLCSLPVLAQVGASGAYTSFDPLHAPAAPPLQIPPDSTLAVVHNPVIPLPDYQQRKDISGKQPLVTGVPGLTFTRPSAQPLSASLSPAATLNFEGI